MMSFRKLFMTGALALTVFVLAPAKASADWLFTPFVGSTFGGSATISDILADNEEEFESQLTYGGSLAYLGAGAIGFEIDFGYAPNFFGNDGGNTLVGDGNVTTLMTNLMLAVPAGPIRPYASGGVGLIKTQVDDVGQFFNDIDRNSFGFNAGGGILFMFDHVGVRGDIRYFRAVDSDDDDDIIDLRVGDFRFWRGTVGVTFRF